MQIKAIFYSEPNALLSFGWCGSLSKLSNQSTIENDCSSSSWSSNQDSTCHNTWGIYYIYAGLFWSIINVIFNTWNSKQQHFWRLLIIYSSIRMFFETPSSGDMYVIMCLRHS